jgi:peptide deformylase
VERFDEALGLLIADMIDTMHAAPGVGLAGPQVGVAQRIFVYDIGEGSHVLINPTITRSEGSWGYDEGCLSVPELYWPIVRPAEVDIEGQRADGTPVAFHATGLLARVMQHELDHLNGTLLLEHLTDEQRREAKRTIRTALLRGGGTMPR